MNTSAKLIFLNAMDQLLTLVPDDLFPTMQARLAQKAAIRKANEEFVELEEREYAAAALKAAAQNQARKGGDPKGRRPVK